MNHSAIHQHTPIHTAERGKAASPSSPQVIKANVTAIVVTDNRIAYIKSVPPPRTVLLSCDALPCDGYTTDPRVSMGDDNHPVFSNGGTSLMVHAQADDMKSDPAGNAGDRVACGLITK